MGSRLTFNVPGTPVPKARARTGKGFAYTPARTKNYEAKVRALALIARQAQGWKLTADPVAVKIVVRGLRANADLDNMMKSSLDGMTGVAYEDDRQVHKVEIVRDSGDPPGLDLSISRLDDDA